MFAFHPDMVFSPFAWPRHILDKVIQENLDYMEPIAEKNQETLINTLREMKSRPTFAQQWNDHHKPSVGGRQFQAKLSEIRKDKQIGMPTIEDIYQEHCPELYDWWMECWDE